MIEVRQLRKYYQMGDSTVHALDGVDLDIGEGEFLSITGPSGSGKSTIMHLLGCLDRPTSGTHKFKGQLVNNFTTKQLARIRNQEVGFVFQTFNLINRTSALDNVAVPLIYARQTDTRKAAMAALDRVGLTERAHHRPSELSGGERQRVAIARAIVNSPSLLFADEPTGNLDTKTGEQIMHIVHELHGSGVTIVLVTHESYIAGQAERIIEMRDGRIIRDHAVDSATRRAMMMDSAAQPMPGSGSGDPMRGSAVEV